MKKVAVLVHTFPRVLSLVNDLSNTNYALNFVIEDHLNDGVNFRVTYDVYEEGDSNGI